MCSSPRHLRVYKSLRQEILTTHHPQDRLPSERLLAQRFGVSMVTVREAVLKLCQEGLLQRKQGSGTYVLDHHQSRHVGLLIEMELGGPRVSYYYWRILRVLPELLGARNIPCQLYTGHLIPGQARGEPTYPEFLAAFERGDLLGVAALATILPPVWRKRLEQSGIPLVGTNTTWRHAINFSRYELVGRAVRWVVGRGRRRVGFLGGVPMAPIARRGKSDYDGYCEALRECGIEVDSRWVRRAQQASWPRAGWEQFREIWSAGPQKPDALIITDDMLLMDVVAAMLDLGIRIPDDLLVVSQSCRGSDIIFPQSVARMEVDPDVFAARAADTLAALLQGGAVDRRQTLPCRWINPTEASLEGYGNKEISA